LQSSFGQLFGPAGSRSSFEEQLWGLALERNFSAATLVFSKATFRSSFGELLSGAVLGAALGTSFGEQLWRSYIFFLGGVLLSANLGPTAALTCWFVLKLDALYCDGLYFDILIRK
jgi:hypothetical protein